MRFKKRGFFQPKKRSKLKNRRIDLDGYKFASKLEAAVYQKLRILANVGHIKILKHQVRVSLSEAKIIYVPDFMCLDVKTETIFYVEAKGFPTPDWKIKKKLWSAYGPAPLQIWKGTYTRPFIEETVPPPNPLNYSVKHNLFSRMDLSARGESHAHEKDVCNSAPPNPHGLKGSNE